ncbi:hypothetical protein VPHF89G1_0046 [Vibrio phage F89 g1]
MIKPVTTSSEDILTEQTKIEIVTNRLLIERVCDK